MKLFNQKLELEAIKSICENKDSSLLGSLDADLFYTTPAQQAFERLKFKAKSDAAIMSWSILTTDPALSEETRELLLNCDFSDSKTESKDIVKGLIEYKKSRTLLKISEEIQDALTKDKVDITKLYSDTAQQIAEVKSGKDLSNCFTRIGENSNVKDKLLQILKGNVKRFIPSGFKQWDNENGGLPIGKLGIIAATSGAGKSLCAEQLCINMGLNGARVCLVPLEMNAVDMVQRFLANKSSLDMSDLNKITGEDLASAKKAYQEFRKFEKLLKEACTSIDLFNPPEDIEMEDLLMILKPFEYDVIIVDYIGLLKGFDDDNQWRKMGAAARYAKIWAETNNKTVICLAQLNDDMIIRYSRAMKEHADFLWSWNAGKINDLQDGKTIIKVEPQKGRNQAQKNFYLRVNYKKMSMEDATEEEIQLYESKHGEASDDISKPRMKRDNKSKTSPGIKTGTVNEDLYNDL